MNTRAGKTEEGSESVSGITVRATGSVEAVSAGETKAEAPMFPEGGLRAWATVAGACLCYAVLRILPHVVACSFLVQFCGFGYTTSYGVYQDYYTRTYLTQSSSSAISWIGSINAFIIIGGGIVSGRLFDRGYFYPLIYFGVFLQCFSLFMLSLCKEDQLWQIFLAQGLGLGIGGGAVYIPSVVVVSHYFQKRRALAMSLVASGSSLGAVMHPIMLNNTFQSLGFANAVRASAGLVTGLLIIASLLMRPRLPPAATHPPFWKSLPRFARDTPFLYAVAAISWYTTGFYFPIFYLQIDAATHGISQKLSFYSLVILNGSSFVGRLAPGFFARRFGVANMATIASGVGAVLILCMISLKTIASVVVIGIIYGFTGGVFVTLMAPLLAILTDDIGELGLRMGIAYGFVGIGGLIGPPINGALLTSKFVWWRPALFSGVMCSVGFAFFVATLLAHRRKVRAKAAQADTKEKENA